MKNVTMMDSMEIIAAFLLGNGFIVTLYSNQGLLVINIKAKLC